MTPRVAIVAPTYQHRAFVEACLSSVIAQTESDWEMVVVDDGSTDGTADLAEQMGDHRIRVLRQEHRGIFLLGDAYHLAVEETTAPLIAILEGDDTWPPDKLARQAPLFDDPAVVLAYGPALLIDAAGAPYARYDRHPSGTRARNDPVGSIIEALAPNNFIVSSTVMVRRDALVRIGGFWQPAGIPYVDHPTWLRLALEGTFARGQEPLGMWRRHNSQFTTSAGISSLADRGPYLAEVFRLAASRDHRFIEGGEATRILADDPARQRFGAAVASGRLQLLSGDWEAAVTTFRGLLNTRRRAALPLGLLGLFAATVHTDIEWAFRITGRLSWPPRGAS